MSVCNQYGKLRNIFLCKPSYFSLQPINIIAQRYLEQGEKVSPKQVLKEHEEFAHVFDSVGVEVVWVEPDPKYPYQVFTRDVGVATKKGVILGNFREAVRQGEEKAAEKVLKNHTTIFGRISDLCDGVFEGGDFMYMNENTAAIGIGARTNEKGAKGVETLTQVLEIEIIPIKFESKYLHLDMIFNVVGKQIAVVCPEALPISFLKLLRDRKFQRIDVPPSEVFNLSCNVLALSQDTILSPTKNKSVNQRLKALGFKVIEVPLDHILKGGGGVHCLSFPIVRDPD